MNYIWAGPIIISVVVSFFTGQAEAVVSAAMASAKDAVQMAIGLLGVMCLWTGMMKIAEKSGLVDKLSRLISPLTRFLFPDVPQGSAAMSAITMNMSANILGVGNAATPMGLKAMRELDKLNKKRKTASNAMCMFAVINTASLQLIPATIIALRMEYGSQNPFEIMPAMWIASIIGMSLGVAITKMLQGREAVK